MKIGIADYIRATTGECAVVEKTLIGRLGSTICKCRLGDGRYAYYKIGYGYAKSDIQAEAARLNWLKGSTLPIPEVLDAGQSPDAAWLLISAFEGRPARHSGTRKSILIGCLAEGLKQIHRLPTPRCPFKEAVKEELNECQRRLCNDELNRDVFFQKTNGSTPEQALEELFRNYDLLNDFVFTHGDYGLSNVIFHRNKLVALIDWGLAGVADLHRDLMTIGHSIAKYLGAQWVSQFHQAYGINNLDPERIRYFTLMDQFFAPSVWIPGPLYSGRNRKRRQALLNRPMPSS